MGYGFYVLPDGREAGYGVEAECDQPGCTAKIDRGLGYLCGDEPDGHRDPSEPGCGRYFCHEAGHHATHECPNPGRSHVDYIEADELREAVSAAQDEIERRITECEGHRALIDAVRAEREAERPFEMDAKPADIGWKGIAAACQRLHAARAHRRAIVDSLPGGES